MGELKNYRNYKHDPNRGIDTGDETLFEPGMTLKPRELYNRLASGQEMKHIPGYYEFNNEDETRLIDPLPDISKMDKLSQIEYYRSIGKELTELKQQIKKDATKNTENVLQDKIAELEAQIEAENNPTPE